MIHVPEIIEDLTLILAAAGVTTLIFKKLKQPLVLGYIIAGFLVGPHFSFFPTVLDIPTVATWAEIGVIFLLFSLGLEFSFKKLVKVGGSASITAVLEVIFMVLIGFTAGRLLGWSTMDSIFLGGILSISSTTIIIRAFDELGLKSKKFAGFVFGILVVEDLVAILLLVLLSTLAASQQFAGGEILIAVLKLVFFLTLWLLAGIFIIPTFLKSAKKLMNDEMMVVISLGLCLLMVMLATKVGFSPALGAFIMGSIIAETIFAEKIEHLTKPIKDLFGAVFFVSVGMLIEPAMLVKYAGPIMVITVVTILGKVFSTTVGALVSGQPLKTSIQSGVSLAQIGEFSFIIATLGLTLNVTSDFLYPIAVAVSAITTFTTPYLIGLADPIYNRVERMLPERWRTFLTHYSSGTQTVAGRSDWKIIIHSYMLIIAINSVLLTGIVLGAEYFLLPLISKTLGGGIIGATIATAIAFTAMSPFLWALAIKRPAKQAYARLMLNKGSNRPRLIMLEVARVALALLFIGFMLNLLFSIELAIIPSIIFTLVLLLIAPKFVQILYAKLEKRFLTNLNEKEILESQAATPEFLPWDAHLVHFTISSNSPFVGKTLSELHLRKNYGVSIALIKRGNTTIHIPESGERLYPGDKVAVLGTDEQLAQFRQMTEMPHIEHKFAQSNADDVRLQHFLVDDNFGFTGKSIRDSGIQDKTRGLIVGIERNGERMLNPDSSTIFENNDIVWIIGYKGLFENLAAEPEGHVQPAI
ncbi:MAG: cation:proton antiporter [Bacteroidota bacterium]